MIYSLTSTNPSHYETIDVQILIPWKCEQVKYYVSNINTTSNFLLSTYEDYFVIEKIRNEVMDQGKPPNVDVYTIYFENVTDYESSLTSVLNKLFEKAGIVMNATRNETGYLKLTSDTSFTITDATHRAKILLGLYHSELPISSNAGELISPSPPITNYANKLYLISLQGQAIHTTKNGMEYTPSIECSIDSVVKSGFPLIKDFNINPIKTVINVSDLYRSSMTLVDFQFEPVVLLSPLFVTLKIKPVKKYTIGISKDKD